MIGKVQKGCGAGGGGRPWAPREEPPPFHGEPRPEAQAAGRHARQEPKEARGAAGAKDGFGPPRRLRWLHKLRVGRPRERSKIAASTSAGASDVNRIGRIPSTR